MIEALLFWGLAVYGAMVLVWQTVNRILRKSRRLVPMNIVLFVHNAEGEIEGTLRTLMVKTSLGIRERKIVVVDIASSDDTQLIAEKMAEKHRCLEYVRVETEMEALDCVNEMMLHDDRVTCVYNVQRKSMFHIVTEDAVCLCQ